LAPGVALGILPFFAALPLRLMLGASLASGEAPMFLFLLFAVLLLALVLLGGVALESGVAWHCPFYPCCLPCCFFVGRGLGVTHAPPTTRGCFLSPYMANIINKRLANAQ
jgi:hypothetical protein